MMKTKDENGKEVSVNHKCGSISVAISELMGVSNAVLENVIFCH